MNALFTAVFIISSVLLGIFAPQQFLPALLGGAQRSIATALTLFGVYAVWMGLAAVAESAGITNKVARGMLPLCGRLLKSKDEKACSAAAMNMTCGLLGAGAATPFAVEAIEGFDKEGNARAVRLLFVINCAGFQLMPSSAVTLRAAAGSSAAADVYLPTLICCCITLVLSVGLLLATERRR